MPTPEEKLETLTGQVIAKVHWGASEREIHEWLKDKHGIEGNTAHRLFATGVAARNRAIRQRALIWLIASAVGVAALIGYVVIQWKGRFVVIGLPVLAVYAVGLLCCVAFIRSLWQLLTGKKSGPID